MKMQRLYCHTEKRMFDVEKTVDLDKFKCPGCGSDQVEDVTEEFLKMRNAQEKKESD
jgi:predicted RNA-binding Zn-ribbon protein involved in translation (DUF1610 family)